MAINKLQEYIDKWLTPKKPKTDFNKEDAQEISLNDFVNVKLDDIKRTLKKETSYLFPPNLQKIQAEQFSDKYSSLISINPGKASKEQKDRLYDIFNKWNPSPGKKVDRKRFEKYLPDAIELINKIYFDGKIDKAEMKKITPKTAKLLLSIEDGSFDGLKNDRGLHPYGNQNKTIDGVKLYENVRKKGIEKSALLSKEEKIIDILGLSGRDRNLISSIIENVYKYAGQFGIDPALALAVITQESGFNPNATSHMGAMGLMQLMPGTASGMGVSSPYNIGDNIFGGIKYLNYLFGYLGKRGLGTLDNVIAGYNAGEGAVEKYRGVPPYRETREYLGIVRSHYNALKKAGV